MSAADQTGCCEIASKASLCLSTAAHYREIEEDR